MLTTSTVNGRAVQLFDDFTWAYADASSASSEASSSAAPAPVADCRDIKLGVQFCGDPARWTLINGAGGDVVAQFRRDDAHYGEFIVESIGTDNGMTLPAFEDLVIRNAANFANIGIRDVKVIETTHDTVAGVPTSTVVYAVPYKGLTFFFANTIVLEAKRETQVVTYSVEKDYSDEDRALHAEFLAATRFNPQ